MERRKAGMKEHEVPTASTTAQLGPSVPAGPYAQRQQMN